MTNPLLLQAISDDYRRDRLAEAARNRLVRLAACCRRTALGRAAARLRAVMSHRTRTTPCCA
jgi:hypothetical protein